VKKNKTGKGKALWSRAATAMATALLLLAS
jgi:hypothetical protein